MEKSQCEWLLNDDVHLNVMQRLTLAIHGWCCHCSRQTRFGHRLTRQVTNIVVDRPLMFAKWLRDEALQQFSCMPNPVNWIKKKSQKEQLDFAGLNLVSSNQIKIDLNWEQRECLARQVLYYEWNLSKYNV